MVDTIRALLAEMADALDHNRQCLMDDRRLTHPLAERARAALAAAQPATPAEGEVAELVALINQIALAWEPDACLLGNMTAGQLARAAELLAQSYPTPPAEGWVAELVADLQECADCCTYAGKPYWAAPMRRAAELLSAHPTPPAPVPVSERPWEREGWCDEQGRCWLCGKVERDWRLLDPVNGVPQLRYVFSHSLPASALPLPTTEEQP